MSIDARLQSAIVGHSDHKPRISGNPSTSSCPRSARMSRVRSTSAATSGSTGPVGLVAVQATRIFGNASPIADENDFSGSGVQNGSPPAGPAITSRPRATSATVLAIGPDDANPSTMIPAYGAVGTRARDGFNPTK